MVQGLARYKCRKSEQIHEAMRIFKQMTKIRNFKIQNKGRSNVT